MALHITMDKGDKVILSDGVVIDMRRTGRAPQISIEAPESIKIQTVFKDSKKMMQMMQRQNNE